MEAFGEGNAGGYMVMPPEAEQLIERIQEQNVDNIGQSKEWIDYHHMMEKLNLQAHQSAQRKQDNFVIENLLTYQKFPTLVANLLATEVWKSNVYPLLQCQTQDAASLRLYFILYHEATLTNLLEVAFYHEHVLESFEDDLMIEMVDYCMRKITWLLSLPRDEMEKVTSFHKNGKEMVEMMEKATRKEENRRQKMEIEYRIAVQSVTILRYICERLHILPLSVISRVLNKHDVLLSLVVLVENPPWTYRIASTGQWKKFVDQKWTFIEPSDLLQLTTTEAQIWIAIYYLLCTKAAREQYQMTQYRKDQLLRIRKYLNDLILDQLPLLADVQRYLDELAIVQVPPNSFSSSSNGSLVMETVPYLRASLMKKFHTKACTLIAKEFDQKSQSFQRTQDLKDLADVYNMEGIEELMGEKCIEEEQGNNQVEEEEQEEEPLYEPCQVLIKIQNHMDTSKKIYEIGEEIEDLQIICQVKMDQKKQITMTKKDLSYFRYPLQVVQLFQGNREISIQENQNQKQEELLLVKNNASIQVEVSFEEKNTKNSKLTKKIECENIQLPNGPFSKEETQKFQKLWKQVGSLQEKSQCIIQMLFQLVETTPEVSSSSTSSVVPFQLGSSMFLSVVP
jgi:hypothetical protein